MKVTGGAFVPIAALDDEEVSRSQRALLGGPQRRVGIGVAVLAPPAGQGDRDHGRVLRRERSDAPASGKPSSTRSTPEGSVAAKIRSTRSMPAGRMWFSFVSLRRSGAVVPDGR